MKTEKKNIVRRTMMALAMSLTPVFAFANAGGGEEDILGHLKSLIKEYYDKLFGIAIGIGIICAIIAIIITLASPTEKGSEKGKSWLEKIVIGLIILMSLGGILRLIQNITAGAGLDINEILN